MGKWEMVRLGDVCEVLDHLRVPVTASNRKKGIYPYYGANGIQDYVDDYIFDDELVLLAEDGGHFGSKDKPIAYRVSGKCWVNNHAHVLKPKHVLDVDYLCYSIMFYDVSNLISGTTRAKLNQAAMRKMTIPLPPLATQQKIADILDCANTLMEKRKAQIQKLDLLVKSQFVEMFGNPVTNPMGWETYELSEMTNKIGSGATPRGGKESYIDFGISLIRSMNVHNGLFKYDDLAYITDEQAKQLDNVEVLKNDVLLNITGASVARSCIVPSDILPARVNQHVSIIRCNSAQLNYIFANAVLTNNSYQRFMLNIGEAGGATRQAITKQQIENFLFILPPLALQTQFAAFVERVEAQKTQLKKSLTLLELNYKSLMQNCFEGGAFNESSNN